jgi:hypothetical protein
MRCKFNSTLEERVKYGVATWANSLPEVQPRLWSDNFYYGDGRHPIDNWIDVWEQLGNIDPLDAGLEEDIIDPT